MIKRIETWIEAWIETWIHTSARVNFAHAQAIHPFFAIRFAMNYSMLYDQFEPLNTASTAHIMRSVQIQADVGEGRHPKTKSRDRWFMKIVQYTVLAWMIRGLLLL